MGKGRGDEAKTAHNILEGGKEERRQKNRTICSVFFEESAKHKVFDRIKMLVVK